MALRAELGCVGLQVVKNKAVEIGYTTSTGAATTVATHCVFPPAARRPPAAGRLRDRRPLTRPQTSICL